MAIAVERVHETRWRRRTRRSFRFLSEGIDPPLGEVAEAYDIEVWDASFTTLLNTYTATEPSYLYTAAQQTTDYGGAADPVYVRIYQRSAAVNRGYELEATA